MNLTLHNEKKNILTLSFGPLNKSARATASCIDGNLIVTEIKELTSEATEWLPELLQEIEDKTAKDWVCLVEDKTHSLKTTATLYDFDYMEEVGRTNLQIALDWYFAMQARGAIVLTEAAQRYQLRLGADTSVIDLETDERGRLRYRLQWANLLAGHRALLMCVVGAMLEEQLSERWVKVMAGSYKKAKEPDYFAIIRALRKADERKQMTFEQRWEADPDVLR